MAVMDKLRPSDQIRLANSFQYFNKYRERKLGVAGFPFVYFCTYFAYEIITYIVFQTQIYCLLSCIPTFFSCMNQSCSIMTCICFFSAIFSIRDRNRFEMIQMSQRKKTTDLA